MDFKRSAPLIIGLGLPVLFILAIPLVIYWPRFTTSPRYDFVYRYQTHYYFDCLDVNYSVKNAEVQRTEIRPTSTTSNCTVAESIAEQEKKYPLVDQLYVYHVKTDTIEPIAFADAKKLKLDGNMIASDGYSVEHPDLYRSIFTDIFGGNDRNYDRLYFVKNGSAVRPLNVTLSRYSFQFIGWILP